MIINGIEHGFCLMVNDEDGENLLTEHFPDLAELNGYIEGMGSEYFGCEGVLAIVEISDGQYGSFGVTHDITLVALEQEEIDDMIEEEAEINAEFRKMFADERKNTTISYADDHCDADEKRPHLSEVAYVCPRCLNELEECACRLYPYYLIQVDRMILPIVRILNMKGYQTVSCCAGHLTSKGNIHVQFAEAFDFPVQIPSGSTYWKVKRAVDFGLLHDPSDESYLEHQKAALERLREWAEALPYRM